VLLVSVIDFTALLYAFFDFGNTKFDQLLKRFPGAPQISEVEMVNEIVVKTETGTSGWKKG
jgi:hypothetical protein